MSLVTTSLWWERARAGTKEPIRADRPMEGYYATTAARGGALIPARIWSDSGRFFCIVGGEARDTLEQWPYLARRPIAPETYAAMMKGLKETFTTPREARKAKLHDLKPRF